MDIVQLSTKNSDLRNGMAKVARKWRKDNYIPIEVKCSKPAHKKLLFTYALYKETILDGIQNKLNILIDEIKE